MKKKTYNIKSHLVLKRIKHLIFPVLISLKLGYKASPSVSSILVYSFQVLRDEKTNRSFPLNDIAQFMSWEHVKRSFYLLPSHIVMPYDLPPGLQCPP